MRSISYLRFLPIVFLLFISCITDDDEGEIFSPVTEEELIEITARVIRNSGLNFPEKFISSEISQKTNGVEFDWPPSDYIRVTRESDNIYKVHLWLDSGNNIIPTSEWRANNPDYCSSQHKYMKPAKYFIQFKIWEITADGVYAVQLNYIDIDNNQRIIHSIMTDWQDWNPMWVEQAMTITWYQLQAKTTINGAVDPCDNHKPYKLYFDSEVSLDDPGALIFESFEMEFSLTFDEEAQTYVGGGEFVWKEGWAYDKRNGTTMPWPPEKVGSFEVISLTLPGQGQQPEMIFSAAGLAINPQSFMFVSLFEFYEIIGSTGDGNVIYRLSNWTELSDPDKIMGSFNEHSRTYDDGVLTEHTSILIGD